MKLTGERIVPDLMDPMNGMLLEHIARYQFAIHETAGRVLDLACGAGYGTQLVAKAAKSRLTGITAVDVSEEIIGYARGRYHHPLITYRQGDALDEAFMDSLGLFDTVLSFETIEHMPDDRRFFDQLMNRLKPGGTLVLSTPFGKGRGQHTNEPFHFHQLTESEFRDLFREYPETAFYYQRGVLIEPPGRPIHYPIGLAVCRKN